MAENYDVAEATVKIVPTFDGFDEKLDAGIESALAQAPSPDIKFSTTVGAVKTAVAKAAADALSSTPVQMHATMSETAASVATAKAAMQAAVKDGVTIPAKLDLAPESVATVGAAAGAALKAAGQGGGGGGGFLSGLLGGFFGGNNGGSLLSQLGLGAGASQHFGIPFARFGSLLDLLGFGFEHALFTSLGIAGSLGGAGLGGGLLGLGSLGVGGVGMGTDLAGLGQAARDIRSVFQAMTQVRKAQLQYNQAIAQFGKTSTQAKSSLQNLFLAQLALNTATSAFSPKAKGAVVAAAQFATQLKKLFDTATGMAEKFGAQIIIGFEHAAPAYITTIGQYAEANMLIIQKNIRPFLKWLDTPAQYGGLGIFRDLEQIFQRDLPTGIATATQGFELFAKIVDTAAQYVGPFLHMLDRLFTRLNGPTFYKVATEVGKLIQSFRDWFGMLLSFTSKQGSLLKTIYLLFQPAVGLGDAVAKLLRTIFTQIDTYLQNPQTKTLLNMLFSAHALEIVQGIGAILTALLPTVEDFINAFLGSASVLTDAFNSVLRIVASVIRFLSSGGVLPAMAGWLAATLLLRSAFQPLVNMSKTIATWIGRLAMSMSGFMTGYSAAGAAGTGFFGRITAGFKGSTVAVNTFNENLKAAQTATATSVNGMAASTAAATAKITESFDTSATNINGAIDSMKLNLGTLSAQEIATSLPTGMGLRPSGLIVPSGLMGATAAEGAAGAAAAETAGGALAAEGAGVGLLGRLGGMLGTGGALAEAIPVVGQIVGTAAMIGGGVLAAWPLMSKLFHSGPTMQKVNQALATFKQQLGTIPTTSVLGIQGSIVNLTKLIGTLAGHLKHMKPTTTTWDIFSGKIDIATNAIRTQETKMAGLTASMKVLGRVFKGVATATIVSAAQAVGINLTKGFTYRQVILLDEKLKQMGVTLKSVTTNVKATSKAIALSWLQAYNTLKDKYLLPPPGITKEILAKTKAIITDDSPGLLAAFLDTTKNGQQKFLEAAAWMHLTVKKIMNLVATDMGSGGKISITALEQSMLAGHDRIVSAGRFSVVMPIQSSMAAVKQYCGQTAASAMTLLALGIKSKTKTVRSVMDFVLGNLHRTINGQMKLTAAGQLGMTLFMQGLRSKTKTLENTALHLMGLLKTTFTSNVSTFVKIGAEIGAGLANGISAATPKVQAVAYEMAHSAVSHTQIGAGSHSPSVYTYKIGQTYVEGFVLGVMSQKSRAFNTVSDLAAKLSAHPTLRSVHGANSSAMTYNPRYTVHVQGNQQLTPQVIAQLKTMFDQHDAHLFTLLERRSWS